MVVKCNRPTADGGASSSSSSSLCATPPGHVPGLIPTLLRATGGPGKDARHWTNVVVLVLATVVAFGFVWMVIVAVLASVVGLLCCCCLACCGKRKKPPPAATAKDAERQVCHSESILETKV